MKYEIKKIEYIGKIQLDPNDPSVLVQNVNVDTGIVDNPYNMVIQDTLKITFPKKGMDAIEIEKHIDAQAVEMISKKYPNE